MKSESAYTLPVVAIVVKSDRKVNFPKRLTVICIETQLKAAIIQTQLIFT